MPIGSKDSVSIALRTLPEVREAAKAYAQVLYLMEGRSSVRASTNDVLNYLMLMGIEWVAKNTYAAAESASERLKLWQGMAVILIGDSSKNEISIKDIAIGSALHELWMEKFSKFTRDGGKTYTDRSEEKVFDRNEIFEMYNYLQNQIEINVRAHKALMKAMEALDEKFDFVKSTWKDDKSKAEDEYIASNPIDARRHRGGGLRVVRPNHTD